MIEHSIIPAFGWIHWVCVWIGMGAGIGLARSMRYRTYFGDEFSKALFLRGNRKLHKIKY